MQRHFSTLIDAGIAKHTEVSESAILFKDGAFEALHYYRVTEDGKEFTAAQLSDRDKQAMDGWSAGKIFFQRTLRSQVRRRLYVRAGLSLRGLRDRDGSRSF